jgi:hypothetical protein
MSYGIVAFAGDRNRIPLGLADNHRTHHDTAASLDDRNQLLLWNPVAAGKRQRCGVGLQ